MNKGYIYLILCAIFFFLSLFTFTFMEVIDTSSCATQPYPIINLFVLIAGIVLMCISLVFFTFYFRSHGVVDKK